MAVPPIVSKLVETFDRNIDNFKSQTYNEAQVRQQFINPFFEALGWDMQNKAGIALAYSDVIHEDAIKVGGSTKAPDYCFRIGGTRKFFLEAKKPSVDIKSDVSPAYQLRRYAWSAKLSLSILTDFEEFAVYDCQIRPNVNDKPSTARIFFCGYKEYGDKWEQIANIFSKEAVLKGLFDKYASEKTSKRGTTTVDKEFLAEIEGWRDELAKNIAIRNSKLSVYDLNFAVQKTIDRILFLRICEDRGIERSEQLLGLINGSRIYPRLFELFEKSDERYNSGIFHFRREKDRPEGPDELSANLKIDDDVLTQILKDLYYPHSPYEFSVMPAEILGNVYEQFLGKVIRLTASHQAKVEEKPEVKKAGGVYYTPSYIVDYIVKNTVGRLLGTSPVSHCEEQSDKAISRQLKTQDLKLKTPAQASRLRILDPACGSGSFLIGAYQYLLDFHRDYYAKEPSKHKKQVYQGKGGQWFLTIDEKKKILLNNIYGVDIDSQAVEVTKLSLLLKVLENETQESLRLFHERALPDLGNNIKCGNSLIGPDFYQNQQLNLFGDEQQRKINAFDWQKEFPDILTGKNTGFDCVIGNPPWGAAFSEEELDYLRTKNEEIIIRMIDSFMYFVYQSSKLLQGSGAFGMILPDVILYQIDNEKLRRYLLEKCALQVILNMGNVFAKVTRPAAILIFKKSLNSKNKICIGDFAKTGKEEKATAIFDPGLCTTVKQASLLEIPKCLFVTNNVQGYGLYQKITQIPQRPLQTYVDEDGIQRGVSPDLKEAFIVKEDLVRQHKLEKGKLRRVLTGGQQVKRYRIAPSKDWLIYTTRDDDFSLIPNICRYISSFKKEITCKEVSEKKHPLYSLHRPREEKIFLKNPKILGVITEDEIVVAPDDTQIFATDGLYVFGVRDDVNYRFIVAIMNSSLFVYLYRLLTLESGRVLAQVKPTILEQLPIRTIDFNNKEDVAKHDKMVSLVEQMLELNKKLAGIKNPNEKTRIQRQIDATDNQIDNLVYDLYGLTPDEIKIVENSFKP